MKQPIDLARRFLALADQDIKTFLLLIENDEIADSQIGFHAQQAVEKCLKAVLVLHEVEFRKTHDLDELLKLFANFDIPLPPYSDKLDELNPYAVTLRYDLFETEIEKLDKELVRKIVKAVHKWAVRVINQKKKE